MVGGVSGISAATAHTSEWLLLGLGVSFVQAVNDDVDHGCSVTFGEPELVVCIMESPVVSDIDAASAHMSDSVVLTLSWVGVVGVVIEVVSVGVVIEVVGVVIGVVVNAVVGVVTNVVVVDVVVGVGVGRVRVGAF